MAVQGDIRTIPVREVLEWLARRHATGTLSLSRGMVAWRFHLRGGRVELASSTNRETMLGHLLLERGLITQAQLADALAQARRTGARLGKILAQAGLVPAASLADLLSAKVEGLLEEALTWTDGRFFFEDEIRPQRRPAVRTAVDLEVVIGRAAAEPQPVTEADVVEVSEIAPPGWPWNEPHR